MNPLILRRHGLLATYKEKPEHMYLTFKVLQSGSFSISNFRGSASKPAYYSTDGGSTWSAYTGGSTAVFPVGTEIAWKASGWSVSTTYGIGTFNSTGLYEAYGNIMSLVNGDNFRGTTEIESYQFAKLFQGNTSTQIGQLVSAENLALPATTLKNYCYWNMFRNNMNLIAAPKLPALNLATRCYIGMFGYTGLTEGPELPATTLYQQCYQGMFDVSALVTAPDLPAVTTADDCYRYMFQNCSSLKYIKLLATSISYYRDLGQWVENVPSGGTFVKKSSLNLSTGSNGIPSGWTVVNI